MLLVVTAYFAASRSYDWHRETRLITHGQKVTAEIVAWERGHPSTPKDKVVPADHPVDILYTVNGKEYRPFGVLAGRKTQMKTGEMITIFVDPSDPARHTARTEPSGLAGQLLGVFLFAPAALLLFAVALWRRRRVLATYRDGEAFLADVVAVGNTPSGPGSRVVSCAPHDGDDARVIKTILPARLAPQPGELLWLVAPPGRPQQAVPAALFQ
jgi:hypothetical protein